MYERERRLCVYFHVYVSKFIYTCGCKCMCVQECEGKRHLSFILYSETGSNLELGTDVFSYIWWAEISGISLSLLPKFWDYRQAYIYRSRYQTQVLKFVLPVLYHLHQLSSSQNAFTTIIFNSSNCLKGSKACKIKTRAGCSTNGSVSEAQWISLSF